MALCRALRLGPSRPSHITFGTFDRGPSTTARPHTWSAEFVGAAVARQARDARPPWPAPGDSCLSHRRPIRVVGTAVRDRELHAVGPKHRSEGARMHRQQSRRWRGQVIPNSLNRRPAKGLLPELASTARVVVVRNIVLKYEVVVEVCTHSPSRLFVGSRFPRFHNPENSSSRGDSGLHLSPTEPRTTETGDFPSFSWP